MKVLTATAAHITLTRLGGSIAVHDENTGHKIGQCDLVRGFAHYYGVKGSAHEGVTAIVRGGTQGLTAALREGLRNGRDDTAENRPPFRTYAVRHNDGTRGRVMGVDGDYTRVSYRENGRDESTEIRSSLLTTQWHRDYRVR